MIHTNNFSRRAFLRTTGATAGAACLPSAARAQDASAEVVYRNGRIYTVNPRKPWAEAVAVRSGRVVALGSNDDVAGLVDKNTKVVDLKGAFVLPGFIHSHTHPHFLYRDEVADRLTISPSDSKDKVVAAVKAYAAKHKMVGSRVSIGACRISPTACLPKVFSTPLHLDVQLF